MACCSIAPLFRSTDEQTTPIQATVTGSIPEWLQGRYIRVGPGLFEIEDFTVNHWFDGFAVLYKFEITNGKVTFMKKFLQSDAYKKALISKRPVFTEFGTKAYTDTTKSLFSRVISTVVPDLTDNCGVNIFSYNDQVFVGSESAILREINPENLDTLDKVDLTKVGATMMSSHFLQDSQGDLYTIATEIFTSASYTVIKVPATDSKNPFKKAQVLCSISPYNKGPSTYHSFAATDNYIVFIEQPLTLNMLKIISFHIKGRSLYDCTEWQPHLLNKFTIVDKRTGKVLPATYMSTKPFFLCHQINCYEEDNQLVVDIIDYDSPVMFDQMFLNVVRQDKWSVSGGGCSHRFVLPIIQPGQKPEEGKNLVTLKTAATAECRGGVIHLTGYQLTSDRGYEQPSINRTFHGKKYRYCYASGMIDCSHLRNSIVKVDTDTGAMTLWKDSDTAFPGEPYFVARPGGIEEEDGILLVPVTNTDPAVADCLVFLDPKTLLEVGRASVDSHVPNVMHGIFLPFKS